MFRLYSKGCEYAIRAMLHMVPGEEPQWFQAKMVCKKAGIPESFTRKIFQALVGGGFLNASRGPGGGYIVTSGNSLASYLKPECVMAMSEAVKKYGRYPIRV